MVCSKPLSSFPLLDPDTLMTLAGKGMSAMIPEKMLSEKMFTDWMMDKRPVCSAEAPSLEVPKAGHSNPAACRAAERLHGKKSSSRGRKVRKHLNLAVQGGGSHGAFTWGVIHRLLEDERIYIDGLSGASSGAVNGVVAADGFLRNRRQGAIKRLEEFWSRISQRYYVPFLHHMMRSLPTPWGRLNLDDTPLFQLFDMMTHVMSPYQFNPMNINPMRSLLSDMVDFDELRRHPEIRLYVAATNVHRCRARVFRTHEMTCDAVMASTCLPTLYQSVKINGESYWDGGYLGNPALFPLVRECGSNDVLVVMVNPLFRKDVPDTAREIQNRLTEINFNATLIGEIRSIEVVNKLLEEGVLKKSQYHNVNFHMIEPPDEMVDYSASSKMNTDWDFLRYLHDLGWKAGDDWLKAHFDDIQVRPTLDVQKRFMDRS